MGTGHFQGSVSRGKGGQASGAAGKGRLLRPLPAGSGARLARRGVSQSAATAVRALSAGGGDGVADDRATVGSAGDAARIGRRADGPAAGGFRSARGGKPLKVF